jgi:nucleoside-diphosphate-sugar epimerase
MMRGEIAVVAGGGAFIGGHLAANLLAEGWDVRAVDIKPTTEWYPGLEYQETEDGRVESAAAEG